MDLELFIWLHNIDYNIININNIIIIIIASRSGFHDRRKMELKIALKFTS